MPQIRPVSDLRMHSADIDRIVNEENTPVFLTKNGYGRMVVLSMDAYDELTAKQELYRLIDDGLAAEAKGDMQDFRAAMAEIRNGAKHGKV